jgi:hypothetical protein
MGIRKVISKTAGPGELEAVLEKLLNAGQERSVGAAVGCGVAEVAPQLSLTTTRAEASPGPLSSVDTPQSLPADIPVQTNESPACPPKLR